MYAHYYTGKVNNTKIHLIHITPTPALNGTTAHKFSSAKEAKRFAKQIGAKAWNY